MGRIAENLLGALVITLIIPVIWLQGLSTSTHIPAIIYVVIVVVVFAGSYVVVDKASEKE